MAAAGLIALQLFLVFAGLSLLAVGGINALLPEIHRQVVEVRGWLGPAEFAAAVALATAAPGPNAILASMIGHRVGGLPGMAAATLGVLGPSALLAWWVGGQAIRRADQPLVRALRQGLVPVAIGLMAAAGVVMAEAASAGVPGGRGGPLLVFAGSTLFVWLTPRSPLWALGSGAAAGALLFG